jgi:hypothetical protein
LNAFKDVGTRETMLGDWEGLRTIPEILDREAMKEILAFDETAQ